MKKFITYIVVTHFLWLQGMELEKPWREKFQKINHTILQTQLGYDPQVELLEDNNPDVIHGEGPTLYIHGWLGSKNAPYLRKRCSDSSKIPGDVIVFNFADASQWLTLNLPNTTISFPYWMPIYKSNFAQEKDIKSLLCILLELHRNDINIPVCYPHSRGAAVLTKVISILNNPCQKWNAKLNALQITDQVREKILNSIKITYLNTPLKNVSLAIQRRCEDRLFFFTYLFPFLQSFVSQTISTFVKKKVLPEITSYNPKDKKEPIEYLSDWKNTITTVLHFQYNDTYVPSDDDTECAQRLLKANPNNTYVIMDKNGGGHNYGDLCIAKIIHALNKEKGCSYLNNERLLKMGKYILKMHTFSDQNVKEYLNHKNEEFKNEEYIAHKSFMSKVVFYSSLAITLALISRKAYKTLMPRSK